MSDCSQSRVGGVAHLRPQTVDFGLKLRRRNEGRKESAGAKRARSSSSRRQRGR